MNSSDWILLGNAVATVIAVISAPLIALWVTGKLQKRSELEKQKLHILSVLIALRHDPIAPDAVRALNLIDAVFADNYDVREAWTRYFSVLNDASLSNPVGWSVRAQKRHDLLIAMVAAVNLKGKISSADLLRTYTPTAMGNQTVIDYWDQQIKLKQIQDILNTLGMPIDFTPSILTQRTITTQSQQQQPQNSTTNPLPSSPPQTRG